MFEDKTGRPRSAEEVQEALDAVSKELVKPDLPPRIFVFLPTIREVLGEALALRKGGKSYCLTDVEIKLIRILADIYVRDTKSKGLAGTSIETAEALLRKLPER